MSRADKSWEKEQADQVRTEIKSLIRLNHPNVMKLYAYNLNCKYPEKSGIKLSTILLVLEYCPGGELFDILYYTNQLDAKTARTYFIQMMNGIQACHDVGIVHRDIKPQNLLMDINFQLKLTDFGLSFLGRDGVDVNEIIMKTNYVGTRGYQAPELLKRKKYKKACDIFSAGVVLFILLTGYPPFEQAAKTDKWYLPIVQDDHELFWKQHKGCGVKEDAKELISQMLTYHPTKRITLEQVLESEFCKGKTHTPKELYEVLRKRHLSTSKRRKKDKKKMDEMAHSLKKKRDANQVQELTNQLAKVPCPVQKYEARKTFMTSRWVVRPEYEGEQKEKSIPAEVVDSYMVALHALQCKGYSDVKSVKGNPWNQICTATDMEKSDYQISMKINKDENGVYYFNFKRERGDPLKFHKLWKSVEAYFHQCTHLKDELDEEVEEEYSIAQEANQDDEKQEGTGEDEGKQNE